MTDVEIKEACQKLWTAAMELFDLVDEKGKDAPLDTIAGALKLKAIVDNSESIRIYYQQKNIGRMIALGVTPETLLQMITSPEGQARLDALVQEMGGG